MKDSIDAMIAYHRKWLEKNGSRILERETGYLKEDIESGTPIAFQQIPDSLDGLATYFGIRGTLEVLDGQKEKGWQNISNAIDFRGWGLKLRAESFFRDSGVKSVNLTNYVSQAACLVCVSEKWCGLAEEILRRVSDNADAVDQMYWKSRRFEPFVLYCCKIRDCEAVNGGLVGPYDQVIASWDNDTSLAAALESVCDYHCKNMDDTDGDFDPEFKHSPFDLLPCEVILVNRVRERLGLPIPKVTHRLVSILNGNLPSVTHDTDHELLQRLAVAFDRSFA